MEFAGFHYTATSRFALSCLQSFCRLQTSPTPRTSWPAHHTESNEQTLAPLAPEFSLIGNFLIESTDNKSNPNRGRFRDEGLEAAFQMFLLPTLRADAVAAMEHEYIDNHSKTDFHLEEAYFSFLDLPFDSRASLGRRLVEFGVLNSLHPHERPFADTPLVLANFLGEHSWYDDGVSVNASAGSLTWQNELLCTDVDSSDTESLGFYSMIEVTLDQKMGYWRKIRLV